MRVSRTLLLFLTGLFFCAPVFCAGERITSFDSYIDVKKDGTLNVTETITFVSEGIEIKRGIVREFPTTYYDSLGNRVIVDFNVHAVTLNGMTVPFKLRSRSNGYDVYIGHEGRFLPPGKYTTKLNYVTNRQIGFFENHDELYWNVTGFWGFPIEQITAIVKLPKQVSCDKIELLAFTGSLGAKGTDYVANCKDGKMVFATTRPYDQHENLTIAVKFPKGIVREPSWWQKLWWLLFDNLSLGAFLFALLALLYYFFRLISGIHADKPDDPIIPHFYPPKDMLPADIAFILKKSYKPHMLSYAIVDMAVRGFLTIDYTEEWFSSEYKLTRKEEAPQGPDVYHKLQKRLFSFTPKEVVQSETEKGEPFTLRPDITLNSTHAHLTAAASRTLELSEHSSYEKLLEDNYDRLVPAWIFSALSVAVIMVADVYSGGMLRGLIFSGIIGLITLFGGMLAKTYTLEGHKAVNHIKGFRLFLKTTEEDRLKVIGTPPEKTPQLYEKYLPYAMALGVEEQWTKKFSPIFAHLEKEGHPYQPIWASGIRPGGFASPGFTHTFTGNFSRAIAASSKPPGSTSSFGGSRGGGGYSGGGGGGGGGRGW